MDSWPENYPCKDFTQCRTGGVFWVRGHAYKCYTKCVVDLRSDNQLYRNSWGEDECMFSNIVVLVFGMLVGSFLDL